MYIQVHSRILIEISLTGIIRACYVMQSISRWLQTFQVTSLFCHCWLAPWNGVRLKRSHPVGQEIPPPPPLMQHATRRFTIVFTVIRHWPLPWAIWIQSTSWRTIFFTIRFNVIHTSTCMSPECFISSLFPN